MTSAWSRMVLRVMRAELQDNRYPLSFGVPGDFSTIVRKDGKKTAALGSSCPVDSCSMPEPRLQAESGPGSGCKLCRCGAPMTWLMIYDGLSAR